MNTTGNVTTNATVSTLMSLLNAEYNMNKVADYVHMKESRTIDSRYINISTYDTICTVEETTVTDETFTLIEGRYADECEHDTAYHYIYLNCNVEGWRVRIIVNSKGTIAEIKEICTADQMVEILRSSMIGKPYDELAVRKILLLEDKGETAVDTVEGCATLNDGKEYRCIGYYVQVEEAKGIKVILDDNDIVSAVETLTMNN